MERCFSSDKAATQAAGVVARYADAPSQKLKESQFFGGQARHRNCRFSGLITAHASGGAPFTLPIKVSPPLPTALIQRGETPLAQSFNADVMPVLTKMGCNGGSCHGALNGQNGFKLSLFGYEPDKISR